MKIIKDQQGRSRYMNCILAAAPFPAARLRPSLFKYSIQHFDVLVSAQQSLQALHLVPNVDIMGASIASSCLSQRLSRQSLHPSLIS